jgi:nucleotide-binding universal stress UspA family protein
MKTLIVPLDGGPKAEGALPVARRVAMRSGAELVLMRATKHADTTEAQAYLTRAARELEPVPTRIHAVAADRPVAEAILAVTHNAPEGMVCMAAHGRGLLGAAVLGSTAEALLASTTEPVMLLGPGVESARFPEHARLLVPIDGSVESETIADLAVDLARQFDLEPAVLLVAHPLDDETARHGDETIERAAAHYRDAGLATTTSMLVSSSTVVGIVGYAQTIAASMIVMNTHLRKGLDRLVLGSVTMDTVRASHCPVVVRHPA